MRSHLSWQLNLSSAQDIWCHVVIYLIHRKMVLNLQGFKWNGDFIYSILKALNANNILVLSTGLSYVRHLKTVRTHLLWLVHHNKISSEENGVNYTQGLTDQVWRNIYHKGQVSLITSGLSLRARRLGFSPRILRYIPSYFDIKPACWLRYSNSNPRLFFVYPHLLQMISDSPVRYSNCSLLLIVHGQSMGISSAAHYFCFACMLMKPRG